tara:strand:- start:343 stop:504 length:162 start_codon:yes stop_codon:yes gene_type:complete
MKKYKSKIEIKLQTDFYFTTRQLKNIEKLIQDQLYKLKWLRGFDAKIGNLKEE